MPRPNLLRRSLVLMVLVVLGGFPGGCGSGSGGAAPSAAVGFDELACAAGLHPLTVTWSLGPYAGTVDVEVSFDDGVTWILASEGTADDGVEEIRLPDGVGEPTACLVRVSGADGDPSVVTGPFVQAALPLLPACLARVDVDGGVLTARALPVDGDWCRVVVAGGDASPRTLEPLPRLTDCAMAWGDLDHEGFLELALAGRAADGPQTRVWRWTGSTLEDSGQVLTGLFSCALAWGDFDGDGWADLAVAGDTSSDVDATVSGSSLTTRIYRNVNGTLELFGVLPGVCDGVLAWGDVDGDGGLELAVAGWDGAGPVARIYDRVEGTFTARDQALAALTCPALAFGDLDGDGFDELVVAGRTGDGEPVTRLYANVGGTLSSASLALPGRAHPSVELRDVDGDGDPDLLLFGEAFSGYGLTLFENVGGSLSATGVRRSVDELHALPWCLATRPPVVGGDLSGSVTEGVTEPLQGRLVLAPEPAATVTVASPPAYGALEVDGEGLWTYTLDSDHATVRALGSADSLPDEATLRVATAEGSFVEARLRVTVLGVARPPVIGGVTTGTALEDGPDLVGQLTVTDPDSDGPLRWWHSSCTYGVVDVLPDASWGYWIEDDPRVQALNATETLTDTFVVRVDDLSDGSYAEQVVTITIQGVNDAPVMDPARYNVAEALVTEDGVSYSRFIVVTVTGHDVDDPDDELVARITDFPGAGTGWLWQYSDELNPVTRLTSDSPVVTDPQRRFIFEIPADQDGQGIAEFFVTLTDVHGAAAIPACYVFDVLALDPPDGPPPVTDP